MNMIPYFSIYLSASGIYQILNFAFKVSDMLLATESFAVCRSPYNAR